MLISEIINSNIYQVQIRIRVHGAPKTTWIEITAPSVSVARALAMAQYGKANVLNVQAKRHSRSISEVIQPRKPNKPSAPTAAADTRAAAIKQQQKRLRVQKKNMQVQKARQRLNRLSAEQSALAAKPA